MTDRKLKQSQVPAFIAELTQRVLEETKSSKTRCFCSNDGAVWQEIAQLLGENLTPEQIGMVKAKTDGRLRNMRWVIEEEDGLLKREFNGPPSQADGDVTFYAPDSFRNECASPERFLPKLIAAVSYAAESGGW